MQVDNIFVFIRQMAGLFPYVGYLRYQQKVELLTLKLVSQSRITLATCVPILVFLWARLRPDVRDRRQTNVSRA